MRILIKRDDGGVSIMSGNADPTGEVRKWELAGPWKCVSYREIQDAEVPADRTFRAAWKDSDGAVTVDLSKAREIHREMLRRARKPKLEALDVEVMRNITNSAKLAEIEAKKQELRDATAYPAIDSAATPEDLKLAVPSCLA